MSEAPHAPPSTTVNIYENPNPKGVLPPPWYRAPPGVTKGPTRTRSSIIAGLLIANDEGRRWFKESYNYELPDHHRQDVNIPIRLRKLLEEKGIALGCCTAPRRLESAVSDCLVITQILQDPFVHDGPEAYEEVLQEDRKPIPGVKEEVKGQLKKEFGERDLLLSPSPQSVHFFRDRNRWVQELLLERILAAY
jgi:hypothetical protein